MSILSCWSLEILSKFQIRGLKWSFLCSFWSLVSHNRSIFFEWSLYRSKSEILDITSINVDYCNVDCTFVCNIVNLCQFFVHFNLHFVEQYGLKHTVFKFYQQIWGLEKYISEGQHSIIYGEQR